MQAIFDVLKSIGELFANLVFFVVELLGDLVYVVSLMGQTIAKVPSYLGFLPSVIVSTFVIALTVIVVYKIIGRD